MIDIERNDDDTFTVTVHKRGTTTHQVTVSDDYHRKLTAGRESKEDLVKRSFDLPVIGRYFPEYERRIGGR